MTRLSRFHAVLGLGVLSFVGAVSATPPTTPRSSQPEIGHRQKGIVTVDGLFFHDLNGDGRLARYEDWRLAPEARADDLLAQMTVAEKAGLMMHGTPPSRDGTLTGPWDSAGVRDALVSKHVRFFIHRLSGDPVDLARAANAAQEVAEADRLGIPIVFSSDPRHQVRSTFGLSTDAGRFSLWPEALGFGAIGDPELVRRAASIMAAEYRAVGIRMALSPMADLATEPRWPRSNGTFGDDPRQVAPLVAAYVSGMQGGQTGVGAKGVAAVVKHWVGYGAQPEGYDAHNPYGRNLAFPGGRFADHVAPFRSAFRVKASGVMPTYGVLPASVSIAGRPAEPVGGGFNRALNKTLLRERYGFQGIVLTDWKITDDCESDCLTGTLNIERVGMPWGVEALTKPQRFALALDAGVDQFGGVMDTQLLVDLVRTGAVSEARLEQSARRLLVLMFRLGLFENPYVDPEAAALAVGADAARKAGIAAQQQSLTLLLNRGEVLPLKPDQRRVWLSGLSKDAARAVGLIPVSDPAEADVMVMRIATPFTRNERFFFGMRHHEGMPEFTRENADLQAIEKAARSGKPVIVSVYLDRPAILTPVVPLVQGLLGDYGIEDRALLDVVVGRAAPAGRLPFELPRSTAAVMAQKPDAPSDSRNPLFSRGAGLKYTQK